MVNESGGDSRQQVKNHLIVDRGPVSSPDQCARDTSRYETRKSFREACLILKLTSQQLKKEYEPTKVETMLFCCTIEKLNVGFEGLISPIQ